MNFRTMLSMVGTILLGQGIIYGWYICLIANIVWVAYHYKHKNKESAQLHGFYALNSLIAIFI